MMFQSTRLREARRYRMNPTILPFSRFNPRACVRRDVTRAQDSPTPVSFNPRACVRRDQGGHTPPQNSPGFNPRACVRRDGAAETGR